MVRTVVYIEFHTIRPTVHALHDSLLGCLQTHIQSKFMQTLTLRHWVRYT